MNTLFYAMLTGHLIADFWLQPSKWVMCKKENGWKSKHLIYHALIAAILPTLFTLRVENWWFIPIIFISHYAIDSVKSRVKDNIFTFISDQTIHIAILWLLSYFAFIPASNELSEAFWVYAAGFLLVNTPSGFLIGKFLKPITKSDNENIKNNASAWIGIFERILIIIFVVSGEFQAIGFLVAAKSIFRFNDVKGENNSKAEYFLLGTLVSFLLAILVGMSIKHLV
ncbi:MAG: DUF3307 domain-containing protein [Prolixibacteraceae bacterium]|jgi:hypothetical protein|nr:DUF3307 domain-containing protein [Prolixibacteraceae bacterium]